MTRSKTDIDAIAARTEAWLDQLDPTTTTATDASDLRRIGLAVIDAENANTEIAAGVQAARLNGRSWAEIALVLGVSRQAAQQRFGETAKV